MIGYLDGRIKYDEEYVSGEYGTTTFYFTAPKELLKDYIPKGDFPEAVSMEISVEVATEHMEGKYASVCVSPTRVIEGGMEDYDWHDVELPYDVIEKLIALGENG